MSKTMPEADDVEEKDEKTKSRAPHDPDEINPKLTSDVHYWAEEFNVTGQQLHERFGYTELMSKKCERP